MISADLELELRRELDHMLVGQQRQVLDFARALSSAHTPGQPGQELLVFAGTIDPDDLKIIAQAIAEDCGIDHGAW